MPSSSPFLPNSVSSSNSPKRERRKAVLRAVFGEFVATFIFIYVVCGVATQAKLRNFAPGVATLASAVTAAFISIGLIYSFSEISGGHFNPAITFATALRKKTSPLKSFFYILAQLIGANLAMLCLMASYGTSDIFTSLAIEPSQEQSAWTIFFLELIETFILIFVIFATAFEDVEEQKRSTMSFKGVANSKGLTLYAANPQTKSGFAPLAIGLTIGSLVTLGGCFNPARLMSGAIWSGNFSHHWIYWFGEILGASLACLVEYSLKNFTIDFYLPGYGTREEEENEEIHEDERNSIQMEQSIDIEQRMD